MGASLGTDLKALDSAVASLGRSISYRPPLRLIRLLLIEHTHQNFEQEQEPDGTKWAKLKRPRRPRAWQRKKKRGRRKGKKDKILYDTGLLRGSLSAGWDDLPMGIEWGSNVDYAGFHQYGTMVFYGKADITKGVRPSGWKGVIARPFVGITEDMEAEMQAIVADYIQDEIANRLRVA